MASASHSRPLKFPRLPPPLAVAAIAVAALLLRLVFMLRYPIFNDEAIYLRYGKIMIDTAQHFYSVTVIGKQPLLYWVYALTARVIPDPLTGARLISLLFGLATLAGVFVLTRMVYGFRTAVVALMLYAVTPMFILFDSLAVVDGALVTVFTWILVVLYALNRHYRWIYAPVLGILLGISLWIKTTGLLFVPLVALWLFITWRRRRCSAEQLVIALFLVYMVTFAILAPLVLHPEFTHMFRYQKGYALTAGELLRFPLAHWADTFGHLTLIYLGYLLPFIPAAAVVAAHRARHRTDERLLLAAFLLGFIPLLLTARGIQTRYAVYSALPLIPLAAATLARSLRLAVPVFVLMGTASCVLVLSPPLFFRSYPPAVIYKGEYWQYVRGWPSGYGVMEALRFVDTHRNGQPAFVGVRWDSGNPEDTVLVYAARLPGMKTMFFDPQMEEFPYLLERYRSLPIYFITRNHQTAGLDDHLTLLARFPKPDSEESVDVYRFTP